jgi:hypothetical protein
MIKLAFPVFRKNVLTNHLAFIELLNGTWCSNEAVWCRIAGRNFTGFIRGYSSVYGSQKAIRSPADMRRTDGHCQDTPCISTVYSLHACPCHGPWVTWHSKAETELSALQNGD